MFRPCQTCDAKGFMEGRFCGTIREAELQQLVGCQVIGTYRFCYKARGSAGRAGSRERWG